MKSSIAWIIFIRSSSTRLPGKCYLPLSGLTCLEHIVSSALSSGISKSDIFLATSDSVGDQKIIDIAAGLGINVILGSELYPIKRYFINRSSLEGYSHVARICGDSPFYQFSYLLSYIN